MRVADTLINYDLVDLLHTLLQECVDLLEVQAAGLVLADDDGNLRLMAATSQGADFVEIMQHDAGAGPCIDCYNGGVMISVGDIAAHEALWPNFSSAALAQGFQSICAIPLRLRGRTYGAMNLFGTGLGELNSADAALAQALADVATTGVVQERAAREAEVNADQLQHALETRVIIEQAKGVLVGSGGIGADEALSALRAYAHRNELTLRTVAEGVILHRIDVIGTNAAATVGAARGTTLDIRPGIPLDSVAAPSEEEGVVPGSSVSADEVQAGAAPPSP
ncbi:MAG: GAF and ANTAR domain-containing protein [Rhodoglobus sp.]